MDKVTKYKKIVREIIDSFKPKVSPPYLEVFLIKEDIDGHYIVMSDGWLNDDFRHYGFSVHIQIKEDGKIWMREDTTTDPPITTRLLEAGVPKEDIVLAFHSPIMRPDTGFAVA